MKPICCTQLAVALGLLLSCHITHGAEEGSRQDAFIGYREDTLKRVVMKSKYGEVRIQPLVAQAPKITKLIMQLAAKGSCPSCKFYRHEPAPSNWGVDNYHGPPYALLQGSLADLPETPPFEPTAAVTVKRGHVCIIPNSKEFFIATAEHSEWGKSHSVWGFVDDLTGVLQHPVEPFHTIFDGTYTTRWLNDTFPFTLSLQ